MAVNNGPRLQRVPLSAVEIDRENVRTRYDQAEIEQLRQALADASSRGEEYINPPTVYAVGRGRYRVKHGNQRVMAAQGVVDALWVMVAEPPTDTANKLLDQLAENLLQGRLGIMDQARTVRRLKQLHEDWSLSMIAEAAARHGLNYTRKMVHVLLELTRLAEDVQAMVEREELPYTAAYALRQVPAGKQIKLARRIAAEHIPHARVSELVAAATGRVCVETDVESMVVEESVAAADLPLGLFGRTGAVSAPSIDVSHGETGQLQLQERLRAFGEAQTAAASHPRRAPDAEHRSSAVSTRFELIPVPITDTDEAARVDVLNAQEWGRKASPIEKELAREALFFGGLQVADAIRLVERISEEMATAPQQVVTALNTMGQLIASPSLLATGSGLATLVKIRANHLSRVA